MMMASESEALKTNEFLRRRKLRLQQVREQSKDIAKKVRQRANVEKLQHTAELKCKKEKEYLKHQEKLVKRLELLYAQGVKSVGIGHQQASAIQENVSNANNKEDLSKIRGKEAAAELRKRKQEQLDQQKKILDRKLLAREAANELSRDKASTVANKLIAKPTTSNQTEETPNPTAGLEGIENDVGSSDFKVNKNDMATQWDSEELPNEWEPNVPALSLPKDDRDSVKESNINPESKSERSKRPDLFALSSEMPSSLRGGLSNVSEERSNIRPSLTMVSEYLQSRALRLREPIPSKKPVVGDDLHSLKQTILHTRSSKLEAKKFTDKSVVSSDVDSLLNKKNSVTMYNHSTRHTRGISYDDPGLVVRDLQSEEDAYAKALKEVTTDKGKEKEHLKKLQDMRSKVAMTKQTVEKEYDDTMSFLKSLPKEKCSKHSRISHMDEKRQQMQKDRQQLKLQREFNKIERESRKAADSISKHGIMSGNRKKSKSPVEQDFSDDFESRDLQYSWMPVPESDGNLAIHTIPTTLKERKSGNTVKFSKVDNYHEYRSKHKHTPPTKDTNTAKYTNRNDFEAIHIEKDKNESMDCSTSSSDTSSVENLNLQKNEDTEPDQRLSEDEKIIIYKVLNAKMKKKEKERKRLKLIDDVAKVLSAMDKDRIGKSNKDDNNNKGDCTSVVNNTKSSVSFEQINEGVYKVVNEKGDNMTSLYYSDKPQKDEHAEISRKPTRPCLHKRKRKRQQVLEDAGLQSGSGDESTSRTGKCLVCKDGSVSNLKSGDDQSAGPHPSAATSTSSFKTAAMNEKNDNIDGDFIKLLDDNGKETGKFYIGASGVLKDDAYEITIQLKKKDSARKEEKSESVVPGGVISSVKDSKNTENVSTPCSEPLPVPLPDDASNKAESEKPDDYQYPETESEAHASKDPPWPSSDLHENLINKEAPERCVDQQVAYSSEEKMETTRKQFVDKGVYTNSQLSFVLPCDFPKTDVFPRPATSTYTQTSMNSPNTRPVYIHMSSSTSTAYMSPPEMILPKCLRQNNRRDRSETDKSQEERYITGRHDRDQDSICMCQHCLLYEKLTINKADNGDKNQKITNNRPRKTSTPPNTARSYMYTGPEKNTISKSSPKNHKECRKCDSRASYTDTKCRKSNMKRNKLSSNYNALQTSTNTKTFRSNINEKVHKSNLNPVIKNYVQKLLEINSNGLKAIEIANQECSSVSTPGSSIIEVSHNINSKFTNVNNKISLEQIKMILKQQIFEECVKDKANVEHTLRVCHSKRSRYCSSKLPKTKRSVHKVKSLNISKKIMKRKKSNDVQYPSVPTRTTKPIYSTSYPSSNGIMDVKKSVPSVPKSTKDNKKIRSRSSPTPRYTKKNENSNDNTGLEISDIRNKQMRNNKNNDESDTCSVKFHKKPVQKPIHYILPPHKATLTSPESENYVNDSQNHADYPTNSSTQTNHDVESEINLIKMAEDKIQNMEKIADLTEKCTKRLSNLAKILEEVRKNKSLAYSHVSTSDTTSDSDQRSDKDKNGGVILQQTDPIVEAQKETNDNMSQIGTNSHDPENKTSSEYIPFLKDIPKPEEFKLPDEPPTNQIDIGQNKTVNSKQLMSKIKTRPPPALSRITIKYGQDVIPHELSTVVEVDSPMSVKLKNQSSKGDLPDQSNQTNTSSIKKDATVPQTNPDLLQNSNSMVSKPPTSNSGLPDETKIQMMDLKHFNEVMLRPFISLQDYAKQCDVGILDEGSNMDDNVRDDLINDELSSMHSDGSLPDVIAELLKRKIIAEPFKFDALSNINSTTVSSESTLSVLALSKARNNKKKSSVVFQNKENISETSDTLSISSNPDLENAFKKLGMGWASSTLKKTKERLALSSSSNTSSSSLQFKTKNVNNQEIPALVTDSVMSPSKITRRKKIGKDTDRAKNAEQQTSLMTSMTVKEFLTNELAKKITFTNKSHRNESDDEFVSLLETKMPDEMKHSSQNLPEDHSVDSLPSGSNNRARTSTPVQIFKSMTYHSSSGSNMSNGLFSNADDLSSVKVTSNSMRNHSTSEKGDLTIPNCSLKVRKGASDCSKSD